MKTKNELILNKLIELRYVALNIDTIYFNYLDADGEEVASELFNPEKRAADFALVLNALISVCGKREYEISIHKGYTNKTVLLILDNYGDVFFRDTYTRASVAEAFCKVTGISEVSDET